MVATDVCPERKQRWIVHGRSVKGQVEVRVLAMKRLECKQRKGGWSDRSRTDADLLVVAKIGSGASRRQPEERNPEFDVVAAVASIQPSGDGKVDPSNAMSECARRSGSALEELRCPTGSSHRHVILSFEFRSAARGPRVPRCLHQRPSFSFALSSRSLSLAFPARVGIPGARLRASRCFESVQSYPLRTPVEIFLWAGSEGQSRKKATGTNRGDIRRTTLLGPSRWMSSPHPVDRLSMSVLPWTGP